MNKQQLETWIDMGLGIYLGLHCIMISTMVGIGTVFLLCHYLDYNGVDAVMAAFCVAGIVTALMWRSLEPALMKLKKKHMEDHCK